jgi:hypothetical protein
LKVALLIGGFDTPLAIARGYSTTEYSLKDALTPRLFVFQSPIPYSLFSALLLQLSPHHPCIPYINQNRKDFTHG